MNINNVKLNRPEPLEVPENVLTFGKENDYLQAAKALYEEKLVLIEGQYPAGLEILSELKKIIFRDNESEKFHEYRDQRTQFHYASNNLLIPVRNNKINLEKSPEIGWLKELYPDISEFILPYPKIQGLNSSWQWYLNGIQYPGLQEKIHPYYGVYFPTRSDHLYLFDYWLKKYSGSTASALDMGTGCGVLAFQLLTKGFEKVYAADINPNAVVSVHENAKSFGFGERLNVFKSDLFEQVEQKVDLIVFNPPWLPSKEGQSGLDSAIYFDSRLFSRFFSEAGEYLPEGGKIAFLFSNLGLKEELIDHHPVIEELEKNRRFKKVKQIRRKADKPSGKTRRRDHRKNEFVELWELEKL